MPLGEKGCTKKICPFRYYGTKKPPEIKQVIDSCEDAKNSYILELKQKLKLRKLCHCPLKFLKNLNVVQCLAKLGSFSIYSARAFSRKLTQSWGCSSFFNTHFNSTTVQFQNENKNNSNINFTFTNSIPASNVYLNT